MAAEREVSVPMTENASGGSMAEDVVYSIFNAGVNKNVIIIMNVSFFLLICSLVALGFLWEWNIHVFVLLTAAIGLTASTQWFLFNLAQVPVPPPKKDEDEGDDEDDKGQASGAVTKESKKKK